MSSIWYALWKSCSTNLIWLCYDRCFTRSQWLECPQIHGKSACRNQPVVWPNPDLGYPGLGLSLIYFQVQVETIGEFGVFFILFFAGLEFSPDKIRKVWRIAIQGPTIIMLVMIYVGITIGSVVLKNVPLKECAFISACLSLSSTPLVMKFLQSNEKSRVS